MINIDVLIPILLIAISIISGIAFYFFTEVNLTTAQKKTYINQFISFLINFVLFIWLGKVVLNATTIFEDPFAVLARPSDAKTFYFAVILLMINISYHILRHDLNVVPFVYRSLPILIVSSFTYEFIKITFLDNKSTWPYLTLLFLLVLFSFFAFEKMKSYIFIYIVSTGWLVGQFIISLFSPYIVFFQYMINEFFIIVTFVLLHLFLIYFYKKYKKQQNGMGDYK